MRLRLALTVYVVVMIVVGMVAVLALEHAAAHTRHLIQQEQQQLQTPLTVDLCLTAQLGCEVV